jgi:hypothetical protein
MSLRKLKFRIRFNDLGTINLPKSVWTDPGPMNKPRFSGKGVHHHLDTIRAAAIREFSKLGPAV